MDINISLKDLVIPKYGNLLKYILNHEYTHYVLEGGRGSTKSSFVSICIILLIMSNPKIHAVCFRKVANTIQNSIHPQITWAIYQLGLEDLFLIPKTYSSPIVYKPTGQRILFMGLDDPMKVKSIKLPFGYIGITWFEELDQFAGERELRTVLQSTMRGGDKFWDFRSFNPPISRNNWANEYAEDCQLYRTDSTIVAHNTYLDVPEYWLGTPFIEEALELKELNPRAYEHEYLGQAVGTGGDVFPNVEDLDMDDLVGTFDHIYNGIDWGFARDPFRFVKMHFDRTRSNLFIFAEYDTVKTRNVVVFDELYKQHKLIRKNELVTADSAEQKSIADFKAWGAYIRGAEKGPESVRYGIKWLQGLRHIYIDKKRCPKTYKEFVNYEYEQDSDGNFISAYPDANNHCLVGDTLVDTLDGQIPIKDLVGKCGKLYAYDIKSNSPVVTDFTNCRLTFEEAEIYQIELEDGRIVECTYDHPILTSNRGYVKAYELCESDDIVTIH